ncbi:glycosyltransferase family 4 protein [Microbacterium enclense]|uniref:glycosyltransferase family 4 protein n=1 Tax=Microbacterium enclense TaxID=993073 RepID=UPI0036DE42E1
MPSRTPRATPDLKVALVCDYSLDYLGGAQSAFLDEARILAADGAHVTVVAPRTKASRRSAAAHPATGNPAMLDVEVRRVLPGLDLPLLRNRPQLRRRLREEFTARGIQVVHVHSEFGLTAAAIDVARELGLPVVHTVHTFFWQARMPAVFEPIAALITRTFARCVRSHPVSGTALAPSATDSALRGMTLSTAERADVVVSPSAHQADRLRAAGVHRVAVIPNAAPEATQAEPLTSVDGPVRLIWVGRLAPEKRVLEFVRAARTAQALLRPGALSIEIIGDGPLRGAVEDAADPAGPEPRPDILVTGRLSRDEVRARVRRAHLVALTSLGFDNQPVVVVEAFTEARSVVYVDADLREGLSEGGILVPSDVPGMAEALVRLVRQPSDIVDASRRAHRAAAVFSPAHHVELLRRVYADAGAPVAAPAR